MFQITKINCKTDNLKIDCTHTWKIPDFGDWLKVKKELGPSWLHGQKFSPILGCNLQLEILAVSKQNINIFLKNCGSQKVKIIKYSLILYSSNFYTDYSPRRTHLGAPHLKTIKLTYISGKEFELQPKSNSNEFSFNWNKTNWSLESSDAIPESSLNVECSLVIQLTDDFIMTNQNLDCKSLADDMQKLMLDSSSSDWTLICEGEEIFSHQIILGSRSLVFKKMLVEMAPKESCTYKSQIVDIDLDTFKALISFIYTDAVNLENENIERLFVAADKYEMPKLHEKCELAIVEKLNVENSAEYFLLSYLHGGEQLKEKSMEIISKNFKSVKSTKKWIEIQQNPSLSPAVVQIVSYMSDLI